MEIFTISNFFIPTQIKYLICYYKYVLDGRNISQAIQYSPIGNDLAELTKSYDSFVDKLILKMEYIINTVSKSQLTDVEKYIIVNTRNDLELRLLDAMRKPAHTR